MPKVQNDGADKVDMTRTVKVLGTYAVLLGTMVGAYATLPSTVDDRPGYQVISQFWQGK